MRDEVRRRWISEELGQRDFDALLCTLPIHVLMLTGYCPVVGASAAVAKGDDVLLIVPEDERELAEGANVDKLQCYAPGSLDSVASVDERLSVAVQPFLDGVRIVGCELGAYSQAAPYAAIHVFGTSIQEALRASGRKVVAADAMLRKLTQSFSTIEIDRIALSCSLAERAFGAAKNSIEAGAREADVASAFGSAFDKAAAQESQVQRAIRHFYCMSGLNSVQAAAAFQRSRTRVLLEGDLCLIHCNSSADGYWTDITRTYVLGEPCEARRRQLRAIFDARFAALESIRPGVPGRTVDAAARGVLESAGFGKFFTHGLGHGVGFHAIDHNARPRLHPVSEDVLEEGMVFNIEPGLYFPGDAGMRHCDMVRCTANGAEFLTDFDSTLDSLILNTDPLQI